MHPLVVMDPMLELIQEEIVYKLDLVLLLRDDDDGLLKVIKYVDRFAVLLNLIKHMREQFKIHTLHNPKEQEVERGVRDHNERVVHDKPRALVRHILINHHDG